MGGKQTRQKQQRRRRSWRRRTGGATTGTKIRLIYSPDNENGGLQEYVVVERNEGTPGWGAAFLNMEKSFTNFIRGIMLSTEERSKQLQQTSTYIVNALRKDEVHDSQTNEKEHKLCDNDAKTPPSKVSNNTSSFDTST
jgi:hypothetical protein